MGPYQVVDGYVFFCFWSPEKLGLLKTQISQNNTKPKLTENNEK